jgi:hypothetical protein
MTNHHRPDTIQETTIGSLGCHLKIWPRQLLERPGADWKIVIFTVKEGRNPVRINIQKN